MKEKDVELNCIFKINMMFNTEKKGMLVTTLKKYIDGVSWSAYKMLTIDVNVTCHRLSIDFSVRAIK